MNELPLNNSRFLARSSESGAALLEFAISASLFFMLLLGIVLWGLTIWEMNTVQYATERGARCAILPSPATGSKECGSTDSFALSNAYGLNSTNILSGPASGYFSQNSEDVAYVPSGATSSTTYKTQCVTASNIGTIYGSLLLIKSGPSIGTTAYCRGQQ